MGYNSKSFVDYCLKNNLDFEFEIDASDEDPLLKLRQALGYLQTQNQIDSVVFIVYAPSNIFDISDDEPVEERILRGANTDILLYVE